MSGSGDIEPVRRLAVTGATGFVGGAVCRAATAAGWQVTAFGRRAAADDRHLGGAAYRSWDVGAAKLADPPDVDAVVHCAASPTGTGVAAEVWRTSLLGTHHVLVSFPDSRIVHVSSASVYDPFRPTVRAKEHEAPVSRYLSAYAAAKAAAERLVLAVADRPVVLRPHAVYGPGDPTLLPRLLRNVRAGRLPVPGHGRVLISMTAVGALARACLLAAAGPAAGVFNIADSEPVPVDWALRGLLASAGAEVRPVYVPAAWLAPVARVFPRGRVGRYVSSPFAMERTLDITAAIDRLGYEPAPTTFASP
ncbi:NAD-dependent epimerase/dehydratase family protein [Amycolatopsis vancoresmycina]|uniref:NAD-dependent epimerase/dehydratase n=1 Tax=Amycolatopsis vancoresmycina DSM 44592 TaxID=1292037 RepID=R1I4F7_9PSEU|nr:NAD(P)-dependent oxidoreductase [Amycolatopsis vancoresmycina]EOD65359.1 NAD-dependent epimerase/dehydratase [Amycolatopsis vancoresmycina DSM 44592]